MQHNSKIKTIFSHNFIISLIFCLIVIFGYFWAKPSSEDYDQREHHLPQVEIFVEQPFTLGSPYPATVAMAPGQHVMLSLVSKHLSNGLVGADVFSIRMVNALFGLGLLLTSWWLIYLSNAGRILKSTYLVLPLLFSPYVLGGSIWVMSDNAALLWACIALIILLQKDRSGWFLSLAGIFAALAVFWRQNYIFLIIPMLWRVFQEILKQKNWLPLLLSTIMPLTIVVYLIAIWGGLVPPEFSRHADDLIGRNGTKKLNFSALVFILSLFGAYGIFYIGYLSSELKKIIQSKKILPLVFSLLLGFTMSLLIPLKIEGAYNGILLKISSRLPEFYERSILIIFLCSLGTAIVYVFFKQFLSNKAELSGKSMILSSNATMLVNTCSWIAIATLNSTAFQRYFDSWIILTLSFWASRVTKQNRHSYLGVLLLSGSFLVLSLAKFLGIGV